MALNAKAVLEMLPDLERFLAMKAAEDFEEGMETAEDEADESPEEQAMESVAGAEQHEPQRGTKGPGLGVVIALRPKGSGEKVSGCPDCADGTPHEHKA